MALDTGLVPNAAEIADTFAISAILATHSRGLDRCDVSALKSCYWPDAEVDYGAYKGPALPFAELVVVALADQYELTRHSLSNSLFEFRGDTAFVETCVHAAHLLLGAEEEVLFYGRYLDRLEKREDQWRMVHRQVVVDWNNRIAVTDERNNPAFADLSRGTNTDSDPLFSFLSKKH